MYVCVRRCVKLSILQNMYYCNQRFVYFLSNLAYTWKNILT